MEQILYELPHGWETKLVGEIVKLEYGKPLVKDDRDEEGSFPAYGANGIKCRTNKYYCDKPSIIVGRKGSAGEVTLTEDKFWPLDVTYFVTFDESCYDLFFLYYGLKNLKLTKLAKGVKPGINRNDVYQIDFSFPPLNEQKRIVAKLDALFTRIDTAITHLQQTLELTKALFASTLKAEVSGDGNDWLCFPLNSLGDFSGGGTPAKSKPDYWSGEILWITPKDMKSPELSNSEMKITPRGVSESSAKMLPANSVLIVARSGILRHTLPVCINRIEATVNQDIKVFIPGKHVTPEYIQYLLKGNESFILRQLVKGGVTVESLKYKEFQSHSFPIPDLNEQNRIVTYLDALSERTRTLEAATQEKLNDLTTLKASLLDAAFKGQL